MLALALILAAQVTTPGTPFGVSGSASGSGGVTGSGALHELALWASTTSLIGDPKYTWDGTIALLGTTTNDSGSTPLFLLERDATSSVSNQVLILRHNNPAYAEAPFVSQNSNGEELRYGMDGPLAVGNFWGLPIAHLASINATNTVLALGTNSAQNLYFVTNATIRAMFDSAGNMLIGATTNGTGRATKLLSSSSSSSEFSFVGVNSDATNGAFADYMNNTGDDAFVGSTGSTGFTLWGATRAKTFVTASRMPTGMIQGTLNAAPYSVGTNGVLRQTVTSDGSSLLLDETAPAVVSSAGAMYSDSTSHKANLSNNGDAFDPIARVVSAVSTADTNNITSTLADVTGATVTLAASSKYDCVTEAQLQNSTSAEGIAFQLIYSGTITVGSGVATLTSNAGVVTPGTTQASATTVASGAAAFAAGSLRAHHYLQTNATGTYKLQFSENSAHVSGTATVYQGATLVCTRM